MSLKIPNKPLRSMRVATVAAVSLLVLGCHQIGPLKAYTWQSISMEKTIYKGDSIWCNVWAYKTKLPARGDVIVFQHKDTALVKRLIGLPGDRVEGKDGVVQVNGETLAEPYAEHTGPESDRKDTFGPTVVAPGNLYVLGDNRDHSFDSRHDDFGEVKLSDLVGKAVSIMRSEHGTDGQPIK